MNPKTSKILWLLGFLSLLSSFSLEIAAQTTQNINVCKLSIDRYEKYIIIYLMIIV